MRFRVQDQVEFEGLWLAEPVLYLAALYGSLRHREVLYHSKCYSRILRLFDLLVTKCMILHASVSERLFRTAYSRIRLRSRDILLSLLLGFCFCGFLLLRGNFIALFSVIEPLDVLHLVLNDASI